MAVVFITNHVPTQDYRGLGRYGTVTHITSGKSFPPTYHRLVEEVVQKLLHSNNGDFLCPTGDPLITALCTAVWLQMHPTLNLLMLVGDDVSKFSIHKTDIRLKAERLRDILLNRR